MITKFFEINISLDKGGVLELFGELTDDKESGMYMKNIPVVHGLTTTGYQLSLFDCKEISKRFGGDTTVQAMVVITNVHAMPNNVFLNRIVFEYGELEKWLDRNMVEIRNRTNTDTNIKIHSGYEKAWPIGSDYELKIRTHETGCL